MVSDVLAKLDQARAMTAELQVDWRKQLAERQRGYIKRSTAKYKARHPERYKATHAGSTRKRQPHLKCDRATKAFIAFLYSTQTHCPHCFEPLAEVGRSLDHIQPISKGGKHEPNNLILMCKPCNSAKGAKLNWPPAYRFKGLQPAVLSCFD